MKNNTAEIKMLRVVFCDDDENERFAVQQILQKLKNTYSESISFETVGFPEMELLIKNATFQSDMLILDYRGPEDSDTKGKSHDTAGMKIVNLNSVREGEPIPVVIYSAYIEADIDSIGFEKLQETYPFIIKRIPKTSIAADGLKKLKNFILSKLRDVGAVRPNFEIMQETHTLNKIITCIGESRLGEIIGSLRLNDSVTRISEFGSGGLSGAKILEVTQEGTMTGTTHIILKLAVDPDEAETTKLNDEFVRAMEYNKMFPRRLVNHIDHKWLISSDKKVGGFVMAKVNDAITLHDFLTHDACELSSAEGVLKALFLGERSLARHYAERKSLSEINNWEPIFKNFDDKILQVKDAFKELKPLIPLIQETEKTFNSLVSFISTKQWPVPYPDSFILPKNPLILCHGDFHAKNILVQGKIDLEPVLIDTGSFGMAHWTTDLTRLIVYIFSRGIDTGTKFYYDTHEMTQIAGIASNIIKGKDIQLDALEWNEERMKNNKSIVFTLNWLVENRKKIYESFYCEYEFQLGLMKWFLREFYRQLTPPNRRVIALLAACECFEEAQKSLVGMIEGALGSGRNGVGP